MFKDVGCRVCLEQNNKYVKHDYSGVCILGENKWFVSAQDI